LADLMSYTFSVTSAMSARLDAPFGFGVRARAGNARPFVRRA